MKPFKDDDRYKAIGERVAEPKKCTLAKAMIKQKRALSPSSQPIIAKEGQEHKEGGVCAKHGRLQKKRV